MKAAYLKAPFRVEMRDIPEPSLGAGEVMLKPKLVGICGTDIHIQRGELQGMAQFDESRVRLLPQS